jgi:hypothetical protein
MAILSGFIPMLIGHRYCFGYRHAGAMHFLCALPANTTATVLVPCKSADAIIESPESFRGWRNPPA